MPAKVLAFLLLVRAAVALAAAPEGAPTVTELRTFLDRAEARLKALNVNYLRAGWVEETYITDDTEALAAKAESDLLAAVTELAREARRFEGVPAPPDLARKLHLLKLTVTSPAPEDERERAEFTELGSWLEGTYGKGRYCPKGGPYAGQCLGQSEMERAFAATTDPATLEDLWTGWHALGAPLRTRYRRFVELANKGARQMGFGDAGALWRAGYDMPPEAFTAELERLWGQVRPLYLALHAYVRAQLVARYGAALVPPDGPIPAHLLGNLWAQEWTGLYPWLPVPGKGSGVDLTPVLLQKGVGPVEMVRYGERFFTSLGFEPLPATFFERSLFRRPADREVVCHASATDVDMEEDLRLKMCIQIDDEDFRTIHHELGHDFYFRAYRKQPYLFADSANDGFHEAIGDTIALSITPEYLEQVGLLGTVPGPEGDLSLLMHQALDKVAFLPFGLLVDEWRWGVFSGQVKPEDYQKAWWELRRKYQGVAPPSARSESDFDPGAKYHIPSNTPYARYFLASILQFQFHRGLCRAIGYQGPLHRCSIYGNKLAGERLKAMLEMGKSQPWPDELYALTGERRADATALLEYFAPLKVWLDEENARGGAKVGF